MSVSWSAVDRFWQSVDQRGEQGVPVHEALSASALFAWGINGTTLALPQPHYRFFVPSAYQVVGWSLVADRAGNAVVKVQRVAQADLFSPDSQGRPVFGPVTGPVTFTSVTGGSDPALVSQQLAISRFRNGTTWSPTTWQFGDAIEIFLNSVSGGLQELAFQLFIRHMSRAGR